MQCGAQYFRIWLVDIGLTGIVFVSNIYVGLCIDRNDPDYKEVQFCTIATEVELRMKRFLILY